MHSSLTETKFSELVNAIVINQSQVEIEETLRETHIGGLLSIDDRGLPINIPASKVHIGGIIELAGEGGLSVNDVVDILSAHGVVKHNKTMSV